MAWKDYERWHAKKTALNGSRRKYYFYEREVWWAAIGHNVGDEEDGKGYNFARPVLIIKKFNEFLFYGIPLSTNLKSGKYYHAVTIRGEKRTALLSHVRDYDSRRLLSKLDVINEIEYFQLLLAVILLLKPDERPRNFLPSPGSEGESEDHL